MSPDRPTLLMATDLSARADRALTRAAQLSSAFGAVLEVLHVVDADLPGAIRDLNVAQADRLLREQMSALPGTEGLDWRVRVVAGVDVEAIVERAETLSAKLMVLGATRPGTFRTLMFGATANRLMRVCRVPMLVVRAPFRGPYRAIAVALDASPAATDGLFRALTWWPDADVEAVHVVDPPFGALSDHGAVFAHDAANAAAEALAPVLSRARAETGRTVRLAVEEGDAGPALVERAGLQGSDLLVAGAIGGSSMLRAAFGGTADHLMHEAPCDVLIVHPPG